MGGIKYTVGSIFPSRCCRIENKESTLIDGIQLNTVNMMDKDDKDKEQDFRDDSRISYLTVPSSNQSSRRPSTADVVIDKLKVEKVEGGGLTICGVALAGNCHITLTIFGIFFIVAGIILAYLGFSYNPHIIPLNDKAVSPSAGAPTGKVKKSNSHEQMQIIGPVFIIFGFLMILLGTGLFAITRKVNRNEKEFRLLNSAMQLCQLENSFKRAKTTSTNLHVLAPTQDQAFPVLSLRRGSFWMEPTPVEYPQIPPEGEYPSSYARRGSRSSSPLMDSGVVWSQRPNSAETISQQQQTSLPLLNQQPLQQQQQQQPQQQQQQFLPQQQITTARLSSPILNYYYGARDYSSDIATFPLESYSPVSNPLQVKCMPEEEPKEQSQDSSRPNSGDQSKDPWDTYSRRQSANGTQSDYLQVSVPVITVSSVAPQLQVTPGSASVSTEDISQPSQPSTPVTFEPVSTNLPLSRNGVAIPRLSRHS